MGNKKPRADAKLKNLPREAQEHLAKLLTVPSRPVDDEDEPMRTWTLEELQVEIALLHGFTVSLSTVSEWWSWYRQRERTESAMARAEQAKLEWLKENPDATPDDLMRLGQMVFTSESIEAGCIKSFTALMRERNRAKALEIDQRKLEMLEEKERKLEAAKEELEKRKDQGGLSDEALEIIERTLGMM